MKVICANDTNIVKIWDMKHGEVFLLKNEIDQQEELYLKVDCNTFFLDSRFKRCKGFAVRLCDGYGTVFNSDKTGILVSGEITYKLSLDK